MYIRTIVEDTLDKNYQFLKNEHGLSLYINYNNKNILFDSGPSDVLIHNSKKLNINLESIDYLVLSHGHFDHGGGILPFLKINKKAKIYMQKNCFENYYFEGNEEKEYIGLDPEIPENYSDRIIFTDNSLFQISNNIFLVPNVKLEKNITYNNKSLLINEQSGTFKQDYFEHEQVMIIKDNNKLYLFSGCSHKGIINIVNNIKKIFNVDKIDFLIGGLHLVDDPVNLTPINNIVLDEIAKYLNENVSKTYCCHCTGDPAYNYLKQTLDDKIQYLRTGTEISL